jgi:hypothetical protein
MRSFLANRVSPGTVLALIALVAALAGSAYAAATVPFAERAQKADFAKRAGTAKKAGTAKRAGTAKSAKTAQRLERVDYNSQVVVNPSCASSQSTCVPTEGSAACDPGTVAVGGGAKLDDPVHQLVVDSFPIGGGGGWTARVENFDSNTFGPVTHNFTVFVICTPAGIT